ncbi:fibrinogen C domain-containing protein 1-like [Parambassis ranga]|uniref:Fibrinogen C domain-containing protein 1-like n=1 Tax=Parambassis ranga TaxID=210632 RepID=A0A6P7JGA7_9TELE|nr:fibrinogen C domain-containing protein 1-like [Parambassis ranga]
MLLVNFIGQKTTETKSKPQSDTSSEFNPLPPWERLSLRSPVAMQTFGLSRSDQTPPPGGHRENRSLRAPCGPEVKLDAPHPAAMKLDSDAVPETDPDERSDIGHNEDVHPNILTETDAGVLDMDVQTGPNMDTNWDVPDMDKDNYEDADWHPPNSLLSVHTDPSPDAPPAVRDSGRNATNQTAGPPGRCGEHSSQLTSSGQCRLTATLPPVGNPQRRCPDVFRCTDDVSYWLHENQNRKEQLEELRGTMSELQEELRNHQHRVRALEMQGEGGAGLNSTFDRRLRSLELRQAEADTLLHVHTALLHELQTQLRNLSAAVQQASRSAGCTVNLIRTPPSLSMRDTPGTHEVQDGQFLSLCPSDCASLHHSGVHHSGVYTIVLPPGSTLPVYCDMETEGGGWTVFQRRRDGSVSFNRGWSEYRDGFGEPRGEHWLGNQHLHLLTNQGHYSLRIDLQDWSHGQRYALYQTFRIEGEEDRYRLHVSGFSGTVEDSFGWYHDQRGFSTPDTGDICAEVSHSGWWFHQCFHANLNGVYYKVGLGGRYSLKAQNLLGPDGIVWFSWKDSDFYSLKAVTMMIRPRSFRPRLSP